MKLITLKKIKETDFVSLNNPLGLHEGIMCDLQGVIYSDAKECDAYGFLKFRTTYDCILCFTRAMKVWASREGREVFYPDELLSFWKTGYHGKQMMTNQAFSKFEEFLSSDKAWGKQSHDLITLKTSCWFDMSALIETVAMFFVPDVDLFSYTVVKPLNDGKYRMRVLRVGQYLQKLTHECRLAFSEVYNNIAYMNREHIMEYVKFRGVLKKFNIKGEKYDEVNEYILDPKSILVGCFKN